MLYKASITIPKNIASTSPTEAMLPIAKGIITKFMVFPHPGHASLAHLIILHHEHQIAPSAENIDLHGDSEGIIWEDYYESYQPPYELKLKGWNIDDTYPHTFDVFVAILPRKAIIAYQIADAIKSLFVSLLPTSLPVPSWLGGKKGSKNA